MDRLACLSKAADGRSIQRCADATAATRHLYAAAWVVLLGSGLYLVLSGWGWTNWVVAGTLAIVVLAMVGAIFTGTLLRALTSRSEREPGPLTPAFLSKVANSPLGVSLGFRTGMATGVVFVMAIKPQLALTAAVVVGLGMLGLLFGWWLDTRRKRQQSFVGKAELPEAVPLDARRRKE